jgi:hypothetical protein
MKPVYRVLASFHFALLLPIGSAKTEALAKRDLAWTRRTLRKTVGHTLLIFAAYRVIGVLLGDWVISLRAGK